MTFTERASKCSRSAWFDLTSPNTPWHHRAVIVALLPVAPLFWLALCIREDL